MTDLKKEYGYTYHTYPVRAQEMSTEGGFKRFLPMPGPQEVFNYAMFGLPKLMPLSGETISFEGPLPVAEYLTSAITEIEMDLNCNLSEVTESYSADYVDGMFTTNFFGVRLPKWPATEIVEYKLKYPHTNTNATYLEYTLPSSWIFLRRNTVNVMAATGFAIPNTSSSNSVSSSGFFQHINRIGVGNYQPGAVEVFYKAGFKHDCLPAMVSDLIKTWAAHKYLIDVAPALFPYSSVNNNIDGIGQSVTFTIQQTVNKRIEDMEKKKNDLKMAFKKQFSRTMNVSFVGS